MNNGRWLIYVLLFPFFMQSTISRVEQFFQPHSQLQAFRYNNDENLPLGFVKRPLCRCLGFGKENKEYVIALTFTNLELFAKYLIEILSIENNMNIAINKSYFFLLYNFIFLIMS